jgi:hypothetical protein
MADGKGIADSIPPLANSDYLMADKKRSIQIVLNGLTTVQNVLVSRLHSFFWSNF